MYPQENRARAVMSLDGLWKFKLGDGESADASIPMEGKTELLYVPASYNDQREEPAFRSHRGIALYERTFTVPGIYGGQRLALRFDAVTHDAKVWLDGKLLCEHKGGFLPFEADITELVEPGREYRLTVAADNTIGHSSLPVGNEEGAAFMGSDNAQVPSVQAAKRWQKPHNILNFDFFNYAGINRHVRIYTTPKAYIEDISIITNVQGTDGIVEYEVAVRSDQSAVGEKTPVEIEVLDAEGHCVAREQGERGSVTIADAHLWNPYPCRAHSF